MKYTKIPKSLLDINKPLPWDVYYSNGLLFANKGATLKKESTVVDEWGAPDLFYEASASPSQDFYANALHSYPVSITSLIAGLKDDEKSVMHDGVFKEVQSCPTDFIESIIGKVSQLLYAYEPSPAWAYKAVRTAQSIFYVFKHNTAMMQSILFVRRYFTANRYAAAQAINRAFIGYRCAEVLGADDEEMISLVCAALTCDLSIHRQIDEFAKQKELLSSDQKKYLEDHAERSYHMLKVAQVIDPSWLFWVRMHHKKLHTAKTTNKLHILNDLLKFADIVAARSSLRAGRDPLPLFNAVANVSFDLDKKLTELGSYFIKAMGVVPIGSLIETEMGVGILLSPDSIVLVTNEKMDVRSNFKVQEFCVTSLNDLKLKTPSRYSRLEGVFYVALNQVANKASYKKTYMTGSSINVGEICRNSRRI